MIKYLYQNSYFSAIHRYTPGVAFFDVPEATFSPEMGLFGNGARLVLYIGLWNKYTLSILAITCITAVEKGTQHVRSHACLWRTNGLTAI